MSRPSGDKANVPNPILATFEGWVGKDEVTPSELIWMEWMPSGALRNKMLGGNDSKDVAMANVAGVGMVASP